MVCGPRFVTPVCYGVSLQTAQFVLSFGVGLVLGDLQTALQCGAIAELAFMGFGVGAGGTVPPNPIGPGIIGTLMAITMPEVTPEVHYLYLSHLLLQFSSYKQQFTQYALVLQKVLLTH